MTALLYEAGIHGRTIGVPASISVFRTFIRPILEYGLALCPQESMSAATRAYNRCLTWISASGKGACSDTLGLFGACEPFNARQERLSYSYARRLESLEQAGSDFAVLKAKQAREERPVPGSTFEVLESNHLIRERRRLAAEGMDEDSLPCWKDRIDELIQEVPMTFKSAFIFGGMSFQELKSWIKPLALCPVPSQRAIFLWVLNRSAGPWKVCRHCRAAWASKSHLELCALNLAAVPTGPSQLEDRLFRGIPSVNFFQEIAELITRCVGEHPITVNAGH